MIIELKCVQTLMALGLTAMEGEVYAVLLTRSPATGYGVAQALGKAVANTYKALESLTRKGAVLMEVGTNRRFRAVPSEEWLGRLECQFHARRQEASEALAGLSAPKYDDRLYQLTSRVQVLERCRSMFKECRHVAVLDIFPGLVADLRDDIESASARGIEILVKAYEPTELRDVWVVVRPRGDEITGAVPGDMLSLNIDGAQHLLAVMPPGSDAVHQAIWTGSAVISSALYNGLVNQASGVALMEELEKDTTVEKLRRVFASLRHFHPVSSRGPVYQNLLRRLGADVSNPTDKT